MEKSSQSIPVFRQQRTVAARDTDELAHVNNIVWVRYVVDLAFAHSDALGLNLDAYRKLGGFWIVRRHQIDYHGNAAAGDEIVGETWVSEMRGARSVRHACFFTGDGRRRLVNATTLWAFVDARTLRPRRVPSGIAERFVVCADRGAGLAQPLSPVAS
jgi:acyl-CoA thioester hydrolase